jgi:hypothetical protein
MMPLATLAVLLAGFGADQPVTWDVTAPQP